MSPELVGAFEQQWPDIAKRLQALLAGKNVPASKREDVVQETGLRLFGMWEKVDRARPVWPLVVTIALNLMRDEARRNTEREILGAVPDLPANHDVEHEGLARIEFEQVQQAMAQLSPSHRDVLLNEIVPRPEVPKDARNATKMMRLRARRALTTLLETAVLRAGVFGIKVRRSLGLNDPLLPLKIGAGETGAAPAAALAVAALLFGTMQTQPPSVAHASESPDTTQSAPGEAGTTSGDDALAAVATAGNEVDEAVRIMRARAFAQSDAHRAKKERRNDAGKNGNGSGRGGTDPAPGGSDPGPWGAPPPSDNSPIEIPLPHGDGGAHLGGGAGAGAVGAMVGNRPGGSAPACVAGVEPGSLGCGTEAPEKARVQAGAEVEVQGEKYGAKVDEEVGTEVPN